MLIKVKGPHKRQAKPLPLIYEKKFCDPYADEPEHSTASGVAGTVVTKLV
jgi:hypothetical protein